MYIPWSQDDALEKLVGLIDTPDTNIGKISNWTDKTVDRYVDIMQSNGEQWRRDDHRYRDRVSERKY
jgi:hypothetical protein